MNMNSAHRQEFCVRWNSHLGSIGAAFPQLLAGQRFVDVTLACEGHQVHCHRLVLAACSSYFESILAENPCKHPVIILPSEIKLWEIQALVDFMYKGEVNVTQAGLPQLLRCAEQLRIRGLYGSDAALNLNQLKALTNKAVAAASGGGGGAAGGGGGNSVTSGVGGGGNSGNVVGGIHDSVETDDTATNSTTATSSTTTTASNNRSQQTQQQQLQSLQQQQQVVVKKEFAAIQTHQSNGNLQQQQQKQQQQSPTQLQQQQQQNHQNIRTSHIQTAAALASNVAQMPSSDFDESPDDSTSNAYDQYEDYTSTQSATKSVNKTQTPTAAVTGAVANAGSAATIGNIVPAASNQTHMDTTIEEDHNYVAAHEEDDSFCGMASTDTEHETSANSSGAHLGSLSDASASYKRVRRSEASLAQAAKCVSRGQTFQTVSNMFNIPVSTIRFYMARKGILPKRKRGRGASTAAATGNISSTNVLPDSVMAQALAQVKMEPQAAAYHMLGYKLNEQGATNMI